MLTEQTTVSGAALPLQALKDHLRLGSGFADDGMQDALVESYLRAAMAAVEGRIGKALIARVFKLVLPDWRDPAGQALPVAPVSAVESVTLVDSAGAGTVVAASRYRVMPDRHRPRLVALGTLLPSVPTDGQVEVVFTAGFVLGTVRVLWGAAALVLAVAVLAAASNPAPLGLADGLGVLIAARALDAAEVLEGREDQRVTQADRLPEVGLVAGEDLEQRLVAVEGGVKVLQQFGTLGRAQPLDALQRLRRRVQQPGKAAAGLEHRARQLEHAAALVAGAQQQREQFAVGQRRAGGQQHGAAGEEAEQSEFHAFSPC